MKKSDERQSQDVLVISRILAQSVPTFLTLDVVSSDFSPVSARRRDHFIPPSPTVHSLRSVCYDTEASANLHCQFQCLLADAKPLTKLPNTQKVGLPNSARFVMVVALSKRREAVRTSEYGNQKSRVLRMAARYAKETGPPEVMSVSPIQSVCFGERRKS
jgi:hypothetical protein